jgi:preprotein translocase subunit SecE
MADTKPAKPKRSVKNPETFRERALKASEASDKPSRTDDVKRTGGKVAKPVAAPFKKAAKLKPVRAAGRVILPRYIRDSWQELKKVTWPSWQQSRKLTVAVLIFAVLFGVVIAAVDWGLDRIFRDILFK